MTHLKKKLVTDARELDAIPNIKKKSFYAEFENGHLIALDTKDQTLINFAKSKGLKN
tara:strand:- start:35 stop:205 length:171 start_codon:yes stop_codon:yes gene_type:complete